MLLDGQVRNKVAADLAAHSRSGRSYSPAEVANRVEVPEPRVRKALEYLGRYPGYTAERAAVPGGFVYAAIHPDTKSPDEVMTFHDCCREVLVQCKDEYAKSYAVGGLYLTGSEEIRVQALYLRSNLSYWHGDRARAVKARLDEIGEVRA